MHFFVRKIVLVCVLTVTFTSYAVATNRKRNYAEMARDGFVQKVPIVYHQDYNFDLFGFEKGHDFAKKKYSRIVEVLTEEYGLKREALMEPLPLTLQDFLRVHPFEYLASLSDADAVFSDFEELTFRRTNKNVRRFENEKEEIARRIVTTQGLATSGTILTAQLALNKAYRWAINLGGGYHHAYSDFGSGFCLIADAPIAIKKILEEHPRYRILIVDLDAHHGDGNAAVFASERRVSIFDIYNKDNFPIPTLEAERRKKKVRFEFPIPKGTKDFEYQEILERELPGAIEAARPNLIVYNAGTDVFEQDPLGGLKISAEGIVNRDEFVFSTAKKMGVPIAMILSGGYAENISDVIGRSIGNLLEKKIIQVD